MGGQTLSRSETRIEALKLQSSAAGITIPLLYGVCRVPLNLLCYRNFRAVPHTETQGGKGGGGITTTSYTYVADVVMAMGNGPISGVPRIWRGKRQYAGGLLATQLAMATETFTMSPGASYALSHGSAFAAVVVLFVGLAGQDDYWSFAYGTDYTVTGGTVHVAATVNVAAQATIVYQYITASVDQTALQQLGLSLKTGEIAQDAWSALSGAGDAELGYSGLALLCGQAYALGSNAEVENHNIEVIGPMAYHLAPGFPDVDVSWIVRDVLTGSYGAGFPGDRLDAWQRWSDFCASTGLLASPALTEQQRAADVVDTACRLTNTAAVWSGGKLRMVPYADTAVNGYVGRTYTPDTTPVYALDDDCFLAPLSAKIKSQADRKNHIRVEYLDRGNAYNTAIAEAKDQADIDATGLRSAEIVQAHWLCESRVARQVAQLLLQRSLYVPGEYTGPLPWHFALLDPADLVTVTNTGLGMAQTPLRATVIEETEAGDLEVTFEDYPAGVAGAALYGTQQPAGYQADYNAAPGNTDAAVLFEGPAELAGTTGIEVYAAVRSSSAAWGGCQVWVSLDGTHYRLLQTVYGSARIAQLGAAMTSAAGSLAVAGLAGVLTSGSAADAAALTTLCYLGGASPEFVAYQTATLTGAGAYTLSGLVRHAYGTAAAAHSGGDPFVRVDSGVARSGPLEPSYVGKTLYFKFPALNVWGGGQQSLADVAAYTYTVTGAMAAASVAIGSKVYRQPADPAATAFVLAGSVWYDTDDDNAPYLRQGGAWLSLRDGSIAAAQEAADDAQADATAALTALDAIASDAILSAGGEKRAVVQDYAVLTGEQSGIDAQATNYGITTEKSAYDTAVTALTTYLTSLTPDWADASVDTPVVSATFRAKFADAYTTRQALLNKIAALAKTGITAATNAAAAAASAASLAQGDATAALTDLANIESDGVLTPVEKPRAVLDYAVITTEQSGIDDQATDYGVTTTKTAYDNAVTSLTSYLGGLTTPTHWDDLSGNTTVTGSAFRSAFAAVYLARQALLDAISAAAKARLGALAVLNTVDTAQIAAGAATTITFDNYDFAGAGLTGGFSITQRSFTVTPAVACTIEFTANLTADNVLPDSGNRLSWTVTPAGGSSVTLGSGNSNSANRQPFVAASSFAAAAGVTLTFAILTDKPSGNPSMHAWLSQMRVTEIKR